VRVRKHNGVQYRTVSDRRRLEYRGTRVLMNNEPTTIQQPPSTNQLVI
jgi:hypothetical protein